MPKPSLFERVKTPIAKFYFSTWHETVTFGHFALDLTLMILLNSFWFAGFNEWGLVWLYSE